MKIIVQIGDARKDYVVALTSAPKAYDGFGTLELMQDCFEKGQRLILIAEPTLEWQKGRNGSGMYATITESDDLDELLEREIVSTLWDRVTGKDV